MKKKPLTSYPSIPAPKIDQFTLPELIQQLFRTKQFTKGVQSIISNCIITKAQPPTPSSATSKLSPLSSSSNKSFSKRPCRHLTVSQENTMTINSEAEQEQCEFIFQKQVRNRMYPWMLADDGQQPIECNVVTDQITDIIEQSIETNLHKILNKEFINVTNEILAMREQVSIFTKEELQRSEAFRLQIQKEMQKFNRKIQQQQHISSSLMNQPLQRFSRSKAMLNSSLSNNSTKESNKLTKQEEISEDLKIGSVHHEIYNLKKQLQQVKRSITVASSPKTQVLKTIEQKTTSLQEKLSDLALTTKLSLQEHKQKLKKTSQHLQSTIALNSSKQFISTQIKKSLKSSLKVYLDQILKCKKDIEDLYDRIERNDKGMQQYMGNQLKNVWTLVAGVKTRVQNIQEQFNVGMDQSFVL